MAILAAPQPSCSCLTKGTSSQTPEGLAAASASHAHSRTSIVLAKRSGTFGTLTNRDDDQDERGDGNEDNDEIAVGEIACREVGLCLLHP